MIQKMSLTDPILFLLMATADVVPLYVDPRLPVPSAWIYSGRKNAEIRELLGPEPVRLSRKINSDGLHMLNLRMILIGSNIV